MGQHGREARAAQIEESVLRANREGSMSELHENGLISGVGKGFAAEQSTKDDVVEEVLARKMNGGQIPLALQDRPHRLVGPLEASAVVVEHSGSHVRGRHYGVEAGRAQPAQHGQALFESARTVVDRRDPMAMQVDESSHTTELARSSGAPYERARPPEPRWDALTPSE